MSVPRDLMRMLACPKCKSSVKEEGMFVVCNNCKLAYPILEKTIPDMLVEDAWQLEKAKKVKFRHTLKL